MPRLCKMLNMVMKDDDIGAGELRTRRRLTQRKRLRERQAGHFRDDHDMDDKAGRRAASVPRRRMLERPFKFPVCDDADCAEESIHVQSRATKFVWRHWNAAINEYRQMRSPLSTVGLDCAS